MIYYEFRISLRQSQIKDGGRKMYPIYDHPIIAEYRYYSDECRPLRSNEELLSFHRLPIVWNNLVVPIASRCTQRYFGINYENLNCKGVLVEGSDGKPEVLVCHDLAGNYRDDRFISGSTKWDEYRFYHWSGIDYFCYFSHEYITIPTLPWINAAHQNGVKVLGTVIVESSRGKRILEEILKSENYMRSIVEALVLIAKCCKFEGWLLNVECSLSEDKISMLRDFVDCLTNRMHQEVPYGVVMWYDSIIETGVLSWQNELNSKNKLFFDVCDGMLINYTWNERNLENTIKILDEMGGDIRKVFIGIDVFGRGQQAKFESHITLSKIKKHKFSVGIFAPGWTFEATKEFGVNIFSPNGNEICNAHFINRNDRFWNLLWQYLLTSGPKKLPFYTTFCLGSGKQKYTDGLLTHHKSWFNLSRQSWQPSVPSESFVRYFNDSFGGGSSLKVLNTEQATRLFVVEFTCQNDIILAYSFKRSNERDELQVLLNLQDDISGRVSQLICGDGENIYEDVVPGQKWCKILKDVDLRKILIHLSTKNERGLPINVSPINGWEIRYYYLRCEQGISAKITDIGVMSKCGDSDEPRDGILLGAIHIHEGVPLYKFDDIQVVGSWDFVA